MTIIRHAALLVLIASPVLSDGAFTNWQTGDLIFHESGSAQASAIRAATGSPYTHMGIIEVTDHGVFVIEAARVVRATPVDAFIARGNLSAFAVYRPARITREEMSLIISASREYLGRPYDVFFRLDQGDIYCSELPFHAYQAIGRELGAVQVLGDLALERPEAREIFLSRWEAHPDCAGLDQGACWDTIQTQEIVTPVSIAKDPSLELLFTNMRP